MPATLDTPTQPTESATTGVRMLSAEVIEVDAGSCLVSAEGRLLEAVPAVSCLVQPQAGDRVGLWLEADGRAHVLAVLARREAAPLQLAAPDGLVLRTRRDAEIRLDSGSLALVAERGQGLFGTLRLAAGELVGETRSVRWVSQLARSIVDSLHLVAERSFRHVRGSDHQRSAYLDIEADELAQIRARNTMITATQLTRVDGAQIHVG